ncbi:hypothetical protein BOTBODRAFT_554074 [Botryobasidium botryosum FD-172 SS1]|uniref:Uncharacterized protein n=1 Tax=Botryobasidium botryosum (strain FD-172 SS1) TaxID=930990 RepID=A0A067N266_BOTB1|nr:hypothetical protein BOTBODRAFT_554074 [Botryobasidium botryosum FD-172 SS1]
MVQVDRPGSISIFAVFFYLSKTSTADGGRGEPIWRASTPNQRSVVEFITRTLISTTLIENRLLGKKL